MATGLEFLKQMEEGRFKVEEGFEGIEVGIKNNNIKKPKIREGIIILLLGLPAPVILWGGLQVLRWSELSETEKIVVGFLAYLLLILVAFFAYYIAINDYYKARERVIKNAISDYQLQHKKPNKT